ncbi:MAG: AI-2E family transporter [Marinilabiliales bacterium]
MNNIGKYLGAIIIISIIAYIVWYFSSIIAYILISAVLSLIGQPIVSLLDKVKFWKFKIPRAVSALITLVLLWALLFGFFRIFIPIIADEASHLSSIEPKDITVHLEEPLSKIENIVTKYKLFNNDEQSLQTYIANEIVNILNLSDVSVIFSKIATILGNIFVAFFAISFITFFFLKDESLFYNMVMAITPVKWEKEIKHALHSIKRLLMRYFIGIIIDVSIVITLITIGLSIVGLKLEQALIIALFAGIVNVIPYVGPIMGVSFGLLMGILTNLQMDFYTEMMPTLIYMLIVFISVQILDATLFQPTIYSSSVKAHPLEIFLLIMISGSIAGITGMILAIPSYTVIRVIAKEFFNQIKVVNKLTKKI